MMSYSLMEELLEGWKKWAGKLMFCKTA